MEVPNEWFTVAILATTLGSAAALRLFVEYTKGMLDGLWMRITGKHAQTFVYALIVAYILVYGVSFLTGTLNAQTAFANIFNGPLVAVLAKFMVNESGK